MIDSGNGHLTCGQQLFVMSNLSFVLEKEVEWLNQLTYLKTAGAEDEMKEVKALGSSLRFMMDSIKKSASEAQSSFELEAQRALVNSDKVKSAASDLKSANQEIESFLGETQSNFPPSEELPPATPGSPPVDPKPVEYFGSTLVLKTP